MLDKKQILMGGVFLGVGIYALPIFLKGFPSLPFKIAGGLFMAAGVIYFIAGDTLAGRSGGGGGFDKDIKKRIKSGEITEQKAFQLQNERFEQQLKMEKQKAKLAKQKAEITKIQNAAKPKQDFGAILGGDGKKKDTKLPDVIGNIAPMFGGTKYPMKNVEGMVSEKKKKKDNYDDLRDLF